MGLCCPETNTIHIRMGQTRAERMETFWHETLHALDFSHGVPIPHRLVYKLERPLAQLFAQNAWLQWAQWEPAEVS